MRAGRQPVRSRDGRDRSSHPLVAASWVVAGLRGQPTCPTPLRLGAHGLGRTARNACRNWRPLYRRLGKLSKLSAAGLGDNRGRHARRTRTGVSPGAHMCRHNQHWDQPRPEAGVLWGEHLRCARWMCRHAVDWGNSAGGRPGGWNDDCPSLPHRRIVAVSTTAGNRGASAGSSGSSIRTTPACSIPCRCSGVIAMDFLLQPYSTRSHSGSRSRGSRRGCGRQVSAHPQMPADRSL